MIENSEKELLKKDLENQGTPEEINKFIEDAELLGHEDIAELGRKKLQEISEKAKSIETTSESQISQVESMGGSGEEVTERTKVVDQQIEEVQTEVVKKIEEVKNIPEDGLKEKSLDEIEREKQSVKDLDQLKKIKEHPDYNNLIQIANELRALHKVNKEKGSEEALQNYRRKEESLNKLVDKIAGDSGLSSYKILSASEILNIDDKLEVGKQVEEAKENEIVGENYPISLDYIGKHFKEGEGSLNQVDYEVTGKVMLINGPESGNKDVLTVPISWGNYRSVNWRNEVKSILYKETEGYEKFQTISKKVFFDPNTKDLYWIDDGNMGKPKINSPEMVSLMEEAYSKLKNSNKNEDTKV